MTTRFHASDALEIPFLLILLGVLGSCDRLDQQEQAELYCDMVYRHQQNPSTGWPDYDESYATQCINGELRPGK